MVLDLSITVAWSPPQALRKDCEAYCKQCRECQQEQIARQLRVPRALQSRVPFRRVQLDLQKMSPPSAEGHDWVLSVICVVTR